MKINKNFTGLNTTRIGVIFTNDLSESQISKIVYNNNELEFQVYDDMKNILIINATKLNLS